MYVETKGTCFFFGTGFIKKKQKQKQKHGSIIYVALFIFIYIIHKTEIAPLAPQASGATNFKISPLAPQASGATSSINNNELLITLPNTLTNKPKILPYIPTSLPPSNYMMEGGMGRAALLQRRALKKIEVIMDLHFLYAPSNVVKERR